MTKFFRIRQDIRLIGRAVTFSGNSCHCEESATKQSHDTGEIASHSLAMTGSFSQNVTALWLTGGLLIVLNLLWGGTVLSAQPTVKLTVDPDVREITIGSGAGEISIIAEITPPDAQWTWNCQGPGECLGNKPGALGILYVPPVNIEISAQAIITVTVTDAHGEQATGSVTFTLLAPVPQATPTPSPRPTPPPRQTAMLTVRSNVSGDTVWIDDTKYGATRLDQELPAGKHVIRVEKTGCAPYQETVELQAALTIRAVLACPTWNTAVWDQTQWQ